MDAGCVRRALGAAGRRRSSRTAKPCGPGTPTLVSSWREQSCQRRWLKSPAHRGDHGISRKTIAQGMPGQSGEPVATTLVCLLTTSHTRLRVHWASGIPCALSFVWGGKFQQNPGASRRGIASLCLNCRHCEEHLRRSNPAFAFVRKLDCFAEPVIGRAFARPVGSQ
jgi:hypothetical protein